MLTEGSRLADAYRLAKEYVIEQGYGAEIDWQDGVVFDHVTEPIFLAEAAWVVLACGMRESIVRQSSGAVSAAFHGWESAARITQEANSCVAAAAALSAFNHRGKIAAIATIAAQVDEVGFERLKDEISDQGVSRRRQFPDMGPAASDHLAKNLGMDVAKPDRHLLRITQAAGYSCPANVCRDLSGAVGDRIAVVDLVLWRFATLVPNYLETFSTSVSLS